MSDDTAPATAMHGGSHRFAMLDGWRAASILLVLAGHLFPLGPNAWGMNGAIAASGMALFFTLSGFLITRFLSERADLRVFIIRRFFRIVPLAWIVMITILIVVGGSPEAWAANLLFYANLPPQHLVNASAHLWSLCVEMQFYIGIALYVALFGRRALIGLPAIAAGFTIARIVFGRQIDIVTWFRVDEILAGGILALVYAGWYGERPQKLLARCNPYWMLPLLVASSHLGLVPLTYFRPYIAAITIGATLYNAPPMLTRLFETRVASYIATVSYAVYIFHGALSATWLGSGPTLVKYAKRPLLLLATFGLAHLSTFQFEQRCIALAKRLTRGMPVRLSN